MGRPSKFSTAIADEICERIADGESLRSICDDKDMPGKATVFRWLAENKVFQDQYARAREEQAESLADEILNIADDARNDWMERQEDKGRGWVENGEALRRSQLRIEARKWIASKLKPKKYGERIQQDVQVEHSYVARIPEAARTTEEWLGRVADPVSGQTH